MSVIIVPGENHEKRNGLWIDHRQAVIVVVTDAGEETKHIIPRMGLEPLREG